MIKFHIWNGDVLFNLSSFFQPKCNKKAFQKLWIYELSEILTALDSILETRKVGWFKLQNEGFRAPSTFSEIHQLKLNTISTLQKVGIVTIALYEVFATFSYELRDYSLYFSSLWITYDEHFLI